MNWKLTDQTGSTAMRVLDDGRTEFCQAATLPEGVVVLPADPPDYTAEKAAELDRGRAEREKILNRLNGIRIDMEDAGNASAVDAIKVARQQLKDMTQHATVVAATTATEAHAAFMDRYREIATQLAISAPAAYLAFRGLDL